MQSGDAVPNSSGLPLPVQAVAADGLAAICLKRRPVQRQCAEAEGRLGLGEAAEAASRVQAREGERVTLGLGQPTRHASGMAWKGLSQNTFLDRSRGKTGSWRGC